ncbi:MAG TPA: MBL fold metallo-hydrolase [Pseudonocardiaceae bacterium]|jgi:glyoxylase-like metal-dependent hydrolase (beta-lactamase superfamily II)|nr:MBL fold metallo-hydrolase [Pseudonocardiaceae bacterium]
MSGDRWVEVADRVLVRRHEELDLNTGLVLGDGGCLVVDTRGDEVHGRELAAAVRAVTADPCTVALTHSHFDHCFGTAAFLPADVWAHPGCRTELGKDGVRQRAEWARRYREQGRFDRSDAVAAVRIVLPDKTVAEYTRLLIGGRDVELRHLGVGHTGHDLLVNVPDVGAVFAGDLVENGPEGSFTPESFGPDSHVEQWPATLGRLVGLRPEVVVPGHGDVVDAAFVARQRDELTIIAELRRGVLDGQCDWEDAVRRSPVTEEVLRATLGAS